MAFMLTVCLQKHLNNTNIVLFFSFTTLDRKVTATNKGKHRGPFSCMLELSPKASDFTSTFLTARPSHPSHLFVRGGHVLGRRGPPGPPGVPADVSQPAPAQRNGGPYHVRTHGSSSWAQLWRGCQELRVQGNQRPKLQTDPGDWRVGCSGNRWLCE